MWNHIVCWNEHFPILLNKIGWTIIAVLFTSSNIKVYQLLHMGKWLQQLCGRMPSCLFQSPKSYSLINAWPMEIWILLEGHLISVWFALERATQEQELMPSCLNCHTYFCWTRTKYHSREANTTTIVPPFPVRECTGTIKLYIGRQLAIK